MREHHWRPTPNPDAVRFTLPEPLAHGDGWDFPADLERADVPESIRQLARGVLGCDGICSLYMVGDMATVRKEPTVAWDAVIERVAALMGLPRGSA